MKNLLSFFIHLYQHIAPFSGICRFSPTCSEYTRQAVNKYGMIKGTWMGLKRVVKCNPFFSGGLDPLK